jgi:hypothetical protein
MIQRFQIGFPKEFIVVCKVVGQVINCVPNALPSNGKNVGGFKYGTKMMK